MDRMLGRRVDASDIVQEVLIDANRRLVEYTQQTAAKMPFQIWLRTLVQDRVIDAHRRHRVATRRSLDREQPLQAPAWEDQSAFDLAAVLSDPHRTPAAEAIQHELLQRFHLAVERLDPTDREVILMRHFEGLTNQETAIALELSEAAAGMRYLRALRRLRSFLQDIPSQSHCHYKNA